MYARAVDEAVGRPGWMRQGAAPLRVFINGRFLTQRVTGVQRSAEQLVRALDELLECGEADPRRYRISLLTPRAAVRALPLRHIALRPVGRWSGHLWEQLELPRHAHGGILLSPGNTGPLSERRQVAILHDAAVFARPEAYSRAFVAWYRTLFALLGRRARLVVTPSEFSRGELVRHAGLAAERVRVVRWGAEHLAAVAPDEGVLDRHGLRGRRYLLAVGSMSPNKNFDALLRALPLCAEPRPELVVVGGANPRVFRSTPRQRVPQEGATYVGYVSDAELSALYRHAAAFVFPTLYEGFGFPPLEAMAAGCPAIVSDIPPLREVCGEAATYFDPSDPHALAAAVDRVLREPARAERLRALGYARVRQFSWKDCARELLAALEQAATDER